MVRNISDHLRRSPKIYMLIVVCIVFYLYQTHLSSSTTPVSGADNDILSNDQMAVIDTKTVERVLDATTVTEYITTPPSVTEDGNVQKEDKDTTNAIESNTASVHNSDPLEDARKLMVINMYDYKESEKDDSIWARECFRDSRKTWAQKRNHLYYDTIPPADLMLQMQPALANDEDVRKGRFRKIAFMEYIFRKHLLNGIDEKYKDVEWLMWLDADTIIVRDDLDAMARVQNIIKTQGDRDKEYDIVIGLYGKNINNGVFYMRNDPRTYSILMDIYFQLETEGRKFDGWADQRQMVWSLQEHPEYVANHVLYTNMLRDIQCDADIVPLIKKKKNKEKYICSLDAPGDKLWHFPGLDWKARAKYAKTHFTNICGEAPSHKKKKPSR